MRKRTPRRVLIPRAEQLEDRQLLASGILNGGQWDLTNSLLVKFRDDGSATASLMRNLDATIVRHFQSGPVLIGLVPGMDPTAALTQFQLAAGVEYAQANNTIRVQLVPNDPSFNNQYALSSASAGINAPAGWDIATGDPSVVAAVTDTGIDFTQPDLYLKVAIRQDRVPTTIYGLPSSGIVHTDGLSFLTMADLNSLNAQGQVVTNGQGQPVNAAYTRDRNGNGRIDALDLLGDPNWAINNAGPYQNDLFGWDFVSSTNNPTDDNGHGTFCSGIIGAQTNNGAGVAGVSWGARILPLKFIGADGSGTDADAVSAIEYAADYGAKVINASWGDTNPSPAVLSAIQYAGMHGSVFVAAAGNSGVNIDTTPFYPAWYRESNLITVAATNSSAQLAGFSNYSPTRVDLGAPGENIQSTSRNGAYGFGSGTSFAAPQVTGAIAVIAGRFPSFTPAQLVQQVVTHTRALATLQGRTISGGILDLAAALTPPTPPGAPTVLNAGFEQPSIGPTGSFAYSPSVPNWTFNGGAGLSTNASPFTSGNPSAPEGSQVAFIQGTGQISQAITGWNAGTYTVGFLAAQRGNYQTAYQDLDVLVDGTSIGTIRPSGSTYRSYTSPVFTVTAGNHAIALRGRNSAGGDNTALVDAVAINQASSAVFSVADASFEDVSVGPPNLGSSFAYAPAGSAWTFTGATGLSANGSAFTSGNPGAPDLAQVAFIQSAGGTISQAVAAWPAGSYRLRFQAAQRGNFQSAYQDIDVLVDNALVSTIRPQGTSYSNYATASFTVAAGTHTIAFRGRNTPGGDNTAFIDAVAIEQVTAPSVPVPDASFEQVGVGPPGAFSSFAYGPSGSPWTFASGAGLAANGSGFTSGNPAAPDGSQVAFMQAGGTITLSVNNWTAGNYTLSFLAAQRGNTQASYHDFDVLIDGVLLVTVRPQDTTYRSYTTPTFTVTAGAHTIAFRGKNTAGGDNTSLLDLVQINSA